MKTIIPARAWKKMIKQYGMEGAANMMVDYYEGHGLTFHKSWDRTQKNQFITTFMESLVVINGGFNYNVKTSNDMQKEELDEMYVALINVKPFTVPEDMLLLPVKAVN